MSVELSDIKIINQIASYCYNPGIEFGILSNGEKWLLFNTFQPNPSKRIVWKLDILRDDISNILKKLSCINYEAAEQIEQLSLVIINEELLENIWRDITQHQDKIINILCQAIQREISTKSSSNTLDLDHIRKFVSNKLPTLFRDTASDPVKDNLVTVCEPVEEDISEYDSDELKTEGKNASKAIQYHKKSPVKIQVIFPDGSSVCHTKVADTFMEVIKKIGIDKVMRLNLLQNGIPLVSNKKDHVYTQKLIPPDFYITTHSSTKNKIKHLYKISELLNLDIRIEEIILNDSTSI